MILTDKQILQRIKNKTIVIVPFDPKALGPNSYDVHLGDTLAVYVDKVLDAAKHNKIRKFKIPKNGYLLKKGTFYLGVTQEYTETHGAVPFLDGKSSIGRLGIKIHLTAGKGDVAFCGNWTLEIEVAQNVRVYAGMAIGQLFYLPITGKVNNPYNKKKDAKYSHQAAVPVESMMWKNQFFEKLRQSQAKETGKGKKKSLKDMSLYEIDSIELKHPPLIGKK